jgi:hypothetical protein
MCTEEYHRPNTSNMADRCMHLTNYAVNKQSEKYERESGEDKSSHGSKRSISWLLSWLSEERGEQEANELWSKIGDICAMTVLRYEFDRRYYNSRSSLDMTLDFNRYTASCLHCNESTPVFGEI